MKLWYSIRRPIGYLLAVALMYAGLFLLHAIPALLANAII